MNRVILLIVTAFIPYIISSCTNNRDIFLEYEKGYYAFDIGYNNLPVDSLFHINDIIRFSDPAAILLTDPSCSTCISTAIELHNCYQKSQTTVQLIILLEGPDRSLFDYYFNQEAKTRKGEKPVHILLTNHGDNLPLGLYFIDDNTIQSYSVWGNYYFPSLLSCSLPVRTTLFAALSYFQIKQRI